MDNLNSSDSQTFSYDDLHRLQHAYGNYGTNTDHIRYEYDPVGTPIPNKADLALTVDFVRSGTVVDYTITVVNQGPASAFNTIINNALPDGVTINSVNQTANDACFIATASFGKIDHHYVQNLRNFRDHYLMSNSWGRSFVATYYHYSPPLANWIAKRDTMRTVVSIILLPIIALSWLVLALASTQVGVIAASLLGLWLFKRYCLGQTLLLQGKKLLILVVLLSSGSAAASELYFVHSDHLGTPQVITDESQQVVWEGSKLPFGEVTTTTNTIEFNGRFLGQYYDSESGLNYNYFRDYDPRLGRLSVW